VGGVLVQETVSQCRVIDGLIEVVVVLIVNVVINGLLESLFLSGTRLYGCL